MFTYRDKQSDRHTRIRSFLKTEPFVAVILSAIDFEWTVRRAILGLSALPTKPIHEIYENERSGGLSGLQKHWKKLVKPRLDSDLASIVPNWDFFSNRAFGLRNKLSMELRAELPRSMQGKSSITFSPVQLLLRITPKPTMRPSLERKSGS